MQLETRTFDQVSVRARDPKGFQVAHACARHMLVEGGLNYILGVERPGEDMAMEELKNAFLSSWTPVSWYVLVCSSNDENSVPFDVVYVKVMKRLEKAGNEKVR